MVKYNTPDSKRAIAKVRSALWRAWQQCYSTKIKIAKEQLTKGKVSLAGVSRMLEYKTKIQQESHQQSEAAFWGVLNNDKVLNNNTPPRLSSIPRVGPGSFRILLCGQFRLI